MMPFSEYDMSCLEQAKARIELDLSRHFTIEDIATTVGMGQTKLKILFKKYYGLGLFTYLQEQRMQKAKQLIEETHKPIKEISKLSGYRYSTNFITAFSAYYGIPPGQYRRRYLEKESRK